MMTVAPGSSHPPGTAASQAFLSAAPLPAAVPPSSATLSMEGALHHSPGICPALED